MQRPGRPNQVAPCHFFLACDDSFYMTGQALHANGGSIVDARPRQWSGLGAANICSCHGPGGLDFPMLSGTVYAGDLNVQDFQRLLVDQIQRLMPAADGGDDFVGVGGPDEGLGLLWLVSATKRLMAA